MKLFQSRIRKSLQSLLLMGSCIGLFASATSLSPWAEAAPKKNSNNGRGQEQGRGHCDNRGNGRGHFIGHHDDCCHDDQNEDSDDRDDDRDDDDLVDHECDDHDQHDDDFEDDNDDEDENEDDNEDDSGGGSGGGSTGDSGGGSTGGSGGGGNENPPRTVKLPGKFNPSRIHPRSVSVTQGFDLSLGSIHLSPSTITHVTHGDVPQYGAADQFCPVNQAVYSTRSEFGRTRIVCAPIQDQAEDPSVNVWAVGVETSSAEKIGSFSLLRGVGSVRALEVAGAKIQYSYPIQTGMSALGDDKQALCPRNEVMVGVRTIDSKFPFKRFLTTEAQPYCAKVIVTPKRKSKRARFAVPVDTSGQRRLPRPRL